MLIVHAICIFLFTINKNLNETSGGFAGYLKTFLKIICITLYMAGFILIQFNLNQYMSEDQIDCVSDKIINEYPQASHNRDDLTSIVQYRQLEIAVFYGQFISIIFYVLQCKLFMFMKRRYTADIDSQDPFWMLLSDNQDDFLAGK